MADMYTQARAIRREERLHRERRQIRASLREAQGGFLAPGQGPRIVKAHVRNGKPVKGYIRG